jgi:hypothetical protein
VTFFKVDLCCFTLKTALIVGAVLAVKRKGIAAKIGVSNRDWNYNQPLIHRFLIGWQNG